MAISIGTDPACTSADEPCVSITICVPGTQTCQTLGGLLLDTGSYGIRIFSNALSLNLPNVSGGSPLAECAYFGSGTTFGPVVSADVVMGGEPGITVPIQIIDASYSGQSSFSNPCGTSLDTSPSMAGFNGILGVGLFSYDCGNYCASATSNESYFTCNGSTCSGAAAPLSDQVQNPVSLLPVDNNGVVMSLPSVGSSGEGTLSGTLTFGIGTESDNSPGSVSVYESDSSGNFTTVYAGSTLSSSFLDSGSNALYFPGSSSVYPGCFSYPGFFCPASTVSGSGTIEGINGSSISEPFQIADANTLFSSGNTVFDNLGGPYSSGFDWGLPFFLGRTIAVGINGRSSSLGVGPYWAF